MNTLICRWKPTLASLYTLAALLLSPAFQGCIDGSNGGGTVVKEPPVNFHINVAGQNQIQFGVELSKRYGLGLAGSYNIRDYGTVFVSPEGPTNNFMFGFNLNTRVFLKESWLNFQEVTSLPTGAMFPGWMSGPVVDFESPEINTSGLQWHFYIGTRDQFYIGAAALIKQVDNNFPAVNVGYTFYDNSGNVVLGLLFFGPKLDSNGKVAVPGGIFVGTNISPLLPNTLSSNQVATLAARSQSELQNINVMELAHKASEGKPVKINGKSAFGFIDIRGKDARKFNDEKKVRSLITRYTNASRRK